MCTLNVTDISKRYNRKEVLNKINFTVNKGEILGIIGPNGSGKTTILNILMNIISPTSGWFKFSDGISVGAAVSKKGFFNDVTVSNNISILASITSFENAEELSQLFAIDYYKQYYGSLSAGQKQKVALLVAFAGPYNFFILDEPSNHLDIDSLLVLRKIISQKKDEGCSFLLTSHVLTDLEKLCDRILFLKDGRVHTIAKKDDVLLKYGALESAYISLIHTNKNINE